MRALSSSLPRHRSFASSPRIADLRAAIRGEDAKLRCLGRDEDSARMRIAKIQVGFHDHLTVFGENIDNSRHPTLLDDCEIHDVTRRDGQGVYLPPPPGLRQFQ